MYSDIVSVVSIQASWKVRKGSGGVVNFLKFRLACLVDIQGWRLSLGD